MIKKDRDFSKEHIFEKAQYHQCLPNPALVGELITVQLVTLGLDKVDEEKTLRKLKEEGELKLKDLYSSNKIDNSELFRRTKKAYKRKLDKELGKQQHADIVESTSSRRNLLSNSLED